MKFHQWIVVYFVTLIHFMAFTQRMDVVPFLIELRDVYDVGYAEVGGLVSAFLLGYAFFQYPVYVGSHNHNRDNLIIYNDWRYESNSLQ